MGPKRARTGFTLIELLIVIGLLGALATLVLPRLSVDRTEMLDDSIVEKELSDIQRAFQRFAADCVPRQEDYQRMTQYGLEVLIRYRSDREWEWSFPSQWDPAQGRGWRGPYIEGEGMQTVNVKAANNGVAEFPGQQPVGGTLTDTIDVVCTPYRNDQDDVEDDYYRVIPEADSSGRVTQLWVVFPPRNEVFPADPNLYDHGRRLLLNK